MGQLPDPFSPAAYFTGRRSPRPFLIVHPGAIIPAETLSTQLLPQILKFLRFWSIIGSRSNRFFSEGGMISRPRVFFLLSLALAVAMGVAGSAGDAAARENSLSAEFSHASQEYGVPRELLLAMGYVNTRWEMPAPEASGYEEGEVEARGSYGIMQLVRNPSEDTLGRAAALSGISEESLKSERQANIRGGAALLADIRGQEGESRPSDLDGWYGAVAHYGGGTLYAEQVYGTLQSGAAATISSGERVELSPQDVHVPQTFTAQAAADYGRAAWYGAYWNGARSCSSSINFCKAGRSTQEIDRIIIHVTEGPWSSAINWFKDPRAGASAHYVVRSSDGFIGQSVREEDIAYHAGNWPYNTSSIGIEHEGFVNDPSWFTEAMYRSSARLTAYLCQKYSIPIDRDHIIGHGEVPYPNTHTDPGPYWDWDRYMGLVKSYAGASRPSYVQVVDNADSARFRASARWDPSSWNPQRYGNNYHATTPARVYDPAAFRIRIPERGRYEVYGWWSANSAYSGRAVFRIQTTGGAVLRAVNQRKNGGRWVRLGTFEMAAGDGWYVKLSNRSPSAGHIIADAVRVLRR
jgi:20S proteasome alpha/beta subunit